MQAFIRNDQLNLIRQQGLFLVEGTAASADRAVLDAMRALAFEKVLDAFEQLDQKQKWLLDPFVDIENKEDLERFLHHIRAYLIPFGPVTDAMIKGFFPKAKKMKVPSRIFTDSLSASYMSWQEDGSARAYFVVPHKGSFVGLAGNADGKRHKGVCTFCRKLSETRLFLVEKKRGPAGNYSRRGNWICADSSKCNEQITSLEPIAQFIERLQN